ncbi:MAG: tetratricopeptide repeat protein [Balneolales bacterium]
MDSQERSVSAAADQTSGDDTVHSHQQSYASEPGPDDMQRILAIEQQLDTLDNKNLAVAFYGELISIYFNNGRTDQAAEVSGRMAAITKEIQDWKNAGDWFHQWMLTQDDAAKIHFFSKKSIEMYEEAIKVDPAQENIRTDMAVEYMRIGKPEVAIQHLEEVLDKNPDFLNANYNLGLILYQMGKKDKSISYLNRSSKLAEGSDYEAVIKDFLHKHEIHF